MNRHQGTQSAVRAAIRPAPALKAQVSSTAGMDACPGATRLRNLGASAAQRADCFGLFGANNAGSISKKPDMNNIRARRLLGITFQS